MSLFQTPHADFVRQHLPFTSAAGEQLPPIDGGRTAALARLRNLRLSRYAATRNHLDGDVTRLSPYLRHGCLSLAEVRDAALTRHKPHEVQKFISELGWRDYYQRIYAALGDRILDDLEPYKTGLAPDDYADTLPPDIPAAQTGLACIDAFARQLADTGYLHNHARMWVAAYVVHHRRIKWQPGARWFLTHLLDGDVASNHLSWQWVASTFSHKPYFFNRENLERYTDARYCTHCPARRNCPFAGEYDLQAAKLFPTPPLTPDSAPATRTRTVSLKVLADPPPDPKPLPTRDAVVWAHEDALSAAHPAFATRLPTLVILDSPRIRHEAWSFKRAVFVTAAANELAEALGNDPVRVGEPATLLADFAQQRNARTLVIPRSPAPRIRAVADQLAAHWEVRWADTPPFASLSGRLDLTRFSRYWNHAQTSATQPTRP